MSLVGRQAQVERLKDVLEFKQRAAKNLTILGIEGPGGVGKSSLIYMAEQDIDYKNLKVLKISVDSNEPITTLVDFIDCLIKAIKREARQTYSRDNIVLKETECAIDTARKILSDAQNQTSKKGGDAEAISRTFHRAISLGKHVNKISRSTKEWVDFEKVEEASTELSDAILAFQEESSSLINSLGVFSKGKNLRNHIRKNAAQVFADALSSDIETILSGYNKKNSAKPLPSKISGCERLLLIIDDYESLSEISAEFLARYFLPKLKDSRFQSAVVIAGRDDLTVTHTSWNQHLQMNLLDPSIDVGPLSREDIEEIARQQNCDPDVLWRDTDGYPYFIQLWVEANRRGGETAVSLKKFYDRTTRWMNKEQKGWLEICLLLDEVNIDSLLQMTRSRRDAEKVLSWFEMEGSIRSTDTKSFTVRSYVRGRILDYLRLREPEKISTQENKARTLGLFKQA